MILNYILVTLRNLRKHLTYSIINILGLGLGLATCILLVTWITNELSYDRFHEKADRIYRASLSYSYGGQVNATWVSPTALLPSLQKNFPEIETGVRLYNPSYWNPFIIRQGASLFQENRFYFADSTFFKVFSFKLLQGSQDRALTEPRSVVLTQSSAKKYFGDEDPMGKVLRINDRLDYTVTGVLEDVPSNSVLQFDFMASFSSLDIAFNQQWWSANYMTFLVLAPNADVPALQTKINDLVFKEVASKSNGGPGDYVRYPIIPYTDIYLHSPISEPFVTSSINYIYSFGGIAILILLIACINYINLATAKATDRAKEVSIRKVVGALKKQLFMQFIGESLIITFFAFTLGLMLAVMALPIFNSLTGKTFGIDLLLRPQFIVSCFATLVFIAIAAGAYPAFAITSFQPATVLKGNFKSSGRGIWLRQGLVVFQFGISIILIVGTIVILKQINFVQQVRLGYDKENVVILPLDRRTNELYSTFRQQLMSSGMVSQVGRATESPTQIGGGYTISVPGKTGEQGMSITAMDVDSTFIPALGMELIAGRNFNSADFEKFKADTTVGFILNETALRSLAFLPEDAVGTTIELNGRTGPIIGVLRDFHFSSMHEQIGPIAFFSENYQLAKIFVKLKPGNVGAALEAIKKISTSTLSHRPFEYQFLDEQYSSLYSSEQRIGTIISVFATLAIIIACLGLLGLVSFSAGQRTKEIGIRKVMGATPVSIVLLITRNYTQLVFIAIAIGLPLSWYIVDHWFLSSFVYRTQIGVWPFLLAGLSCLFVSFATASYQAVKAAIINPADTLRTE